jgi:hypothetical protein
LNYALFYFFSKRQAIIQQDSTIFKDSIKADINNKKTNDERYIDANGKYINLLSKFGHDRYGNI